MRKWSKDLGTKKLVLRNFLCSWLFQVNNFSGQCLQCSEPIPEPEVYQETSAICYHFRSLLEVCGLVQRFVSLLSAVKSSLVLHVRLACAQEFFVQTKYSRIEYSRADWGKNVLSACSQKHFVPLFFTESAITGRFETLLHHCWLQSWSLLIYIILNFAWMQVQLLLQLKQKWRKLLLWQLKGQQHQVNLHLPKSRSLASCAWHWIPGLALVQNWQWKSPIWLSSPILQK